MQTKKMRMLVIGAHPDDCELNAGGLALQYRSLGHTVIFVSATNGDTGHYEIGKTELARIRTEETRQACTLAGIESQVLQIGSNQIEADIATRERFICLIRDYKPDLLITHRLNDYHPDHRRTAMLVQDSSYAIRVPHVCPQTPSLDRAPIILYMIDSFMKPNPFDPTVVISIDDVLDTKVRMIHCHRSQVYDWLPWMDGELDQVPTGETERLRWLYDRQERRNARCADRFRDRLVERYGPTCGSRIRCAEAFEVSEYGANLPADQIAVYFPF